VRDGWDGVTNRDNTLKRWAADLQNDFRARLDWCVKSFAQANHRPAAVLNGDTTRNILRIQAKSESMVKLDAAGSADPDGQQLTFSWFIYPEAGSYAGPLRRLAGADQRQAEWMVPADMTGKSVHVILTVRDNGEPPLAAYRRVIIEGL
jgi:hypothetical protein